MAIRAAIDLWGSMQTPPLQSNEAIRAAFKDWLIGHGLWAHVEKPNGLLDGLHIFNQGLIEADIIAKAECWRGLLQLPRLATGLLLSSMV